MFIQYWLAVQVLHRLSHSDNADLNRNDNNSHLHLHSLALTITLMRMIRVTI